MGKKSPLLRFCYPKADRPHPGGIHHHGGGGWEEVAEEVDHHPDSGEGPRPHLGADPLRAVAVEEVDVIAGLHPHLPDPDPVHR